VQKKDINDIRVSGKRVFVRVDFNVPFDTSGMISDDTRIRASLPTIRNLIDRHARVILASHLGRPNGHIVNGLRLRPVAEHLSQLLGVDVGYATDCIGPDVASAVQKMRDGDVLLLENLRFHAEEEENDPAFAGQLAALADIYVNDAFGTAHRAHASTEGITHFLPAVAGLLMKKELSALGGLLASPQKPFACVFGGAKVSDKIGMIRAMLPRVDAVLVGGGLAATFLKARGLEIGNSLYEAGMVDEARAILAEFEDGGVPVILPLDVMIAPEVKPGVRPRITQVTSIPPDYCIVDIGPATVDHFVTRLSCCKTVLWNGPMGIYEIAQFSTGTSSLINYLASLPLTSIVGGGSSVDAVQDMGVVDLITHVSTGGGATLQLLETGTLPGVEALNDH